MGIRILLISDFRKFNSSRPEAEIYISLAKAGALITIMTYPGTPFNSAFEDAGIRVIPFHPQHKFDKKGKNLIREELKTNRYDILQLNNNRAIINGIRAAAGLPVKVVLYRGTTANVHWWDPVAYLKFLHPRVDKIICNSRGVEENFHRQLFFNKRKAITINKGHDPAWYKGVTPADLGKYGVPEKAFVACCVANARKVKGIPYLIKAMKHIPGEYPVYLILAGQGMDDQLHRKLREQLPHPERVIILNYLPDPLGVIAASDCFILGSLHSESITKAVMEAMALGIPPIITNIPGNRELVDNGKTGILVPVKDHEAIARGIISLYENPERRMEMGRLSSEKIKNELNHHTTVEKMLKLYTELAEEEKKSPGIKNE